MVGGEVALPDQLTVLADFPDTMEGYGMVTPFFIEKLKGEVAISFRELHGLERHGDNLILDAVIVADLELALGELLVPTDPADHFLNRSHDDVAAYRDFSGQAQSA